MSSHLEHFSTILAQRSTESDDGSVLLQADEAKALIDTLKSTLESCQYSTPVLLFVSMLTLGMRSPRQTSYNQGYVVALGSTRVTSSTPISTFIDESRQRTARQIFSLHRYRFHLKVQTHQNAI